MFNKRNTDEGSMDKLKDFLKDSNIEDAEILSEEINGKTQGGSVIDGLGRSSLGMLAIALICGMLAGFVYSSFFAGPGGARFLSSYDAGSLTRNVQTAKVQRVKYISEILYSDVDVYDKPSNISGSVIAKLSRDMRVEHLGLVPSLDTKENVGVTRFDIKISRLFSKSFIIPEGTEVNLIGYNGALGEYDATVSLNGKIHSITVNANEVKLPYTRGWVRVRTEYGQEGYVYGETVSVRSLK